MTRVFLDTNVMLDVLLRREPFLLDSARVLDMGFKGKIALYSTPLSFATCLFVARKTLGYANALEALKLLERHVNVATMDASQLHEALYAIAPDFEDMLQFHAAVASGCTHIVTRNEHHFPPRELVVFTPAEFLQSLCQEGSGV